MWTGLAVWVSHEAGSLLPCVFSLSTQLFALAYIHRHTVRTHAPAVVVQQWTQIAKKNQMGYQWDWFKSPFPWVSHGTDLSQWQTLMTVP